MNQEVTVVIEVAAWSFVKRKANGHIDYVSPIPTPFNYGRVPHIMGRDGDPLDAMVLGPRLVPGSRTKTRIQTVALIVDGGLVDDKLICKMSALSSLERAALRVFFWLYVVAKRSLHTVRGTTGPTRFEGWGTNPRTMPSP